MIMAARSMTGFGAAERDGASARVRVEIRSLNHRFLEISLSLPQGLHAREAELKALVSEHVRRARVDVWVSLEPKGERPYRVVVNQALVGELYRRLEEARVQHGIPGAIGAELLTRYPEAVRIEPGEMPGDARDEVLPALRDALAEYDRARRTEGEVLARDIAARFGRLRELVEASASTAECEPQRIRDRLRERLQPLLGDAPIDPDRLHQEIAFLAERSDVTEELVRLRAHLDRASLLLSGEDELGKALDFLLQELGREVNTLGSKSRAPETAGHVLAMKAELEKIREQARNLE